MLGCHKALSNRRKNCCIIGYFSSIPFYTEADNFGGCFCLVSLSCFVFQSRLGFTSNLLFMSHHIKLGIVVLIMKDNGL